MDVGRCDSDYTCAGLLLLVRSPQGCNVNFCHLQHGPHDILGFLGIFVSQQLT